MSDPSVELTVTSILSRGKRGGVILAGTTANGDRYVVRCNWTVMPDSSFPDKGQLWSISGPVKQHTFVARGLRLQEQRIEASEANLLRPSGRNIVAWIKGCQDIPGVGQVKAQKLYDYFGPELLSHIDRGNIDALSVIVSEETAELICYAFRKNKVGEALLWLDQFGIQRHIGQKVISCYAEKARDKIESNPYSLISFEGQWRKVDELAQKRFGVTKGDPRRLEAAVEEVLYRGLKDGHTCLPESEVKTRLKRLLPDQGLIESALSLGHSSQYRKIFEYYQSTGAFLIEHEVAQRLQQMIEGEDTVQQSIFGLQGSCIDSIEEAIDRYERAYGFALSDEQRQAVLCSATSNVSLILGGAGTGKTTVLKALYDALEAVSPNMAIYQIALAGRAAQRMSQATDRESCTIAAFLRNVDMTVLGPGTMVVVDEVSMVDVILFYRLLRQVPPGTKLVLVGDPSQLPPIGPGLVLHALSGHKSIPQIELKVVKRQSEASGIPKVANSVRTHVQPEFAPYDGLGNGVSMVECTESLLNEAVRSIYLQMGGTGDNFDLQIISPTRNGYGGVREINQLLHEQLSHKAEPVNYYDAEFGAVQAKTLERIPLTVGDLVIFTKNDYTADLRNGSLGRILSAKPVEDEESDCCIVDFEGVEVALKTTQVQALSHAFAITVHKSQGSQFSRVIVPIRKSRMLDQTLVYTAITRGVDQVVLVGDAGAAHSAILAPALAARRHVSLRALL